MGNKKELKKYCNLENLNSLNPLEQILLAQLFKNENKELSSSLLKFYKSKQESLDIDPKAFDKWFRTALATKAMDDAPTIQQNITKTLKSRAPQIYEEEEEDEDDDDDDDELECMEEMRMAPMMK